MGRLLQKNSNMAKIILAEDDQAMRHYIRAALEKAGHVVLAFENGADAYESLKTAPCDLLVTDIVMPGMDGIELTKKASALYPDLDIMYITGFAASLLQQHKDYAAKVISKPFHLGDLTKEIETLLSSKLPS